MTSRLRKTTKRSALAGPRKQRLMPLAAGYQLALQSELDHSDLRIATAKSERALQIGVGPAGIQIQAGGLTLTWDGEGGLRLEVERLTLVGSEHVSIETLGDLTLSAGGRMTLTGTDQIVRATVGDVDIRANDNVVVNGERILLNS